MHGHILLDKNLSIQCPQGLNILIIGQNLSVQCPQGLNILRFARCKILRVKEQFRKFNRSTFLTKLYSWVVGGTTRWFRVINWVDKYASSVIARNVSLKNSFRWPIYTISQINLINITLLMVVFPVRKWSK